MIMKLELLISGILVFALFTLSACKDNRPVMERYKEALAEGIAANQRTDDFILGLKFGMRPKDFFDHCTDLNKQQLITEGTGGNSVKYRLEDLEKPGHMFFFPEFTEVAADSGDSSVIYAFNLEFKYEGWAPWSSDSFGSIPLLRDVARVFVDWYGNDFLAVPDEQVGRIVTQVRNNRRISLWIKNESHVRGRIVDLSVAPNEPLLPTKTEVGKFPSFEF